jgi:hypothetical protein
MMVANKQQTVVVFHGTKKFGIGVRAHCSRASVMLAQPDVHTAVVINSNHLDCHQAMADNKKQQ